MAIIPTRHDIQIQFRLSGADANTDAKSLVSALDALETSIYNTDREDVMRVAHELELSNVVRDACLERLRNYRHRRFLVQEARPGSLEIVGLVIAVSYFVLEKTVGESFGEAFKESHHHTKLKEVFRRLIDQKASMLAEHLRRYLQAKNKDGRVKALPAPENGEQPYLVIVEVESQKRPEDKAALNTLGQTLD